MAINPLPPQAFTREILQKAYHWLLTQNASVKDMATSQDILVSMYLKAQRSGDASLETPSIQNFKQELKSLAHLMGDLQVPNGAVTGASPASVNQFTTSSQMSQGSPPIGAQAVTSAQNNQVTSSQAYSSDFPQNRSYNLDAQSLASIAEVKLNLNLSSDSEALRALLSVGYKHLKKI